MGQKTYLLVHRPINQGELYSSYLRHYIQWPSSASESDIDDKFLTFELMLQWDETRGSLCRGWEYLISFREELWLTGGQRVDCGSQPQRCPPVMATTWYSHDSVISHGWSVWPVKYSRSDSVSFLWLIYKYTGSSNLWVLSCSLSLSDQSLYMKQYAMQAAYGETYIMRN